MRLFALHIVAGLFSIAVAIPSAAQSPTTPQSDSTVLPPPAPPNLAPVKVTGTTSRRFGYAPSETSTAMKTAVPLRDVPQAVTVINRALIRDQAMQNMADVVRYVPGITMAQGEGNRDQPTIRGNSTTADFFVDGVRDDAQYFRDLYNVDRVEALKGSNAMIFGRGGGGGVVNRVMKEADRIAVRELTLQGGSYHNRRMTLDVGQGLGSSIAGRLNGMYENSALFRNSVRLQRQGINPTLTFVSPSQNTRATFGYENFIDHRTADRGIPSFGARPLETDVSTFFGNPALSYSDARVHSAAVAVAHETPVGLRVRNSTRFTSYDKTYQNVYPGAVSANGGEVSISAYNSSHQRRNLFNQTDLTFEVRTGLIRHTLLLGAEAGRQVTDNFRQTGYFNDSSTSVSAPVSAPTIFTPVTFRQSASDADNHVTNTVRSIYAQDQIVLSGQVRLIAGVRYESFGLRYHNNRSDSTLRRSDAMISPRMGLVVKPAAPASLYASYGVSYLPSAGDQFSSLTDVTKALEPERFDNLEIGAKWDVADRVSITAAAYQLDRTNTRAPAPDNPGRTVQTGSQRSTGYELGVSGSLTSAWEIAGGFARQHARITSTTASAPAGVKAPLVPRSTVFLWNKYHLGSRLGVGLGVMRQADMYAAISNSVKLPAFTRVDGAVYYTLGAYLRAQMNVENLLNERYYPLAHNNTNITPGSPRAIRLSLTTGF